MKKLLIFGTNRLADMLQKGNVWYVRHYEAYFDQVYVVYLHGKYYDPIINGNTTLIALGSRRYYLDLLLATFRLFKCARIIRPTCYLTGDQMYSWWTSLLIRIILSAKIFLLPDCNPEMLLKDSIRSRFRHSQLFIKRLFLFASYKCAFKVLTSKSFGSFPERLTTFSPASKKLLLVDTLVESLPSAKFYDRLSAQKNHRTPPPYSHVNLIYVGRLHKEKLVDDLIKMMQIIKSICGPHPPITLHIIGDGPQKENLLLLAHNLGVAERINFVGFVPNESLPDFLSQAQIFVSPLTGSSLREAALCSLPVVAYNMDWISGLLQHNYTALLVPPGDYQGMARQVMRLIKDKELYERLSRNVRKLAWHYWSPENLRESLALAFGNC